MSINPNESFLCNMPDGSTVTVFRPSLFRVIPKNSGNLGTERGVKIRFLYRMLVGYRIYLMRIDGEFLAYAMFQKGRIARYPFVEKNMLLMGPYYVAEAHRGNGYAKQLIENALDSLHGFKALYAWIAANNEPSRRALSKIGFAHIGWLNTDGIIKKPYRQRRRMNCGRKPCNLFLKGHS